MRGPSPALVLSLAVLLAGCASAPRARPGVPARFEPAAVDGWLGRQVEELGLPGASVAILQDGQVVFSRGYGRARLDTGEPVTAETAFAIGSVTKQFTCALALLLEEDGRLSLDAPVSFHAPDVPFGQKVTLMDLFHHVGGVRDFYPLDYIDGRLLAATTADAIVAGYAGTPDFEPGARFSYSNTGYTIAGRAIERVTGVSLAAALEQRLFRPLGLRTARVEATPGTSGMAQGYTGFALSAPEPAPPEAAGWALGAFGIAMAPADLVQWDLALMRGAVLRPQSWARMSTPRKLTSGRSTGYACGLGVREVAGDTVYTHSGAVSGFLAYNAFIPRTRSAVAVMVNRDDVDVSALFDGLLNMVARADVPPPPSVAGVPAHDAAVRMFADLAGGRVDRSAVSAAFLEYLTPARLDGARARLGTLGAPTGVTVLNLSERGAMEVSRIRFSFASAPPLTATMFRSPDGVVHQFLLRP